ncbi:3'(2'),5'-bisphosphate nucleotidase CysQ [Stenotrophomonas sp. C3(2023)]|uniref:3'(2'),5'-bisphosphate nucleotidase CysQ n=1 Tax=Stenotrophomonas sp. C3(2023) TaxID=3080277 RepID=UPI00293D026F|nr:3'(2'),5'-bisphosphate nucleotidase CysQ [Stenotrophomonas sp. C3(2023)]MDV3468285.1 3'(2'),5'-bisphosphate nucleotidase CysQ [Stenotrophomonas sp. C3(2023)]
MTHARLTTDLRETVIAIAHEAAAAIMQVYASGFDVTIKDDDSPVTAADLAAHACIARGLAQLTPDLPILSEESEHADWETRRHWGAYWLVDPLDGTREFIKRNGEFSVNIALIYQGAPTFGVVLAPVTGLVWHAMRGEQAYRRQGLHDTVLRTRAPAAAPLRVAASRSHRSARTTALLERMGPIETVAQGSSLKFCRIAEGDLDVYPRLGPTSEWDTAAGQCVLHAAGGAVLSAASGKPFRYNRRPTLLNEDFIALGDTHLPWRDWLPPAATDEEPA